MAALYLRHSPKPSRFLLGLLGTAAALVAVEHFYGLRQAARRRADPQAGDLQQELPHITVFDTLGFHLDLTVPTLAKGLILRRPWVTRIADWLDLDRRAIRRMSALRDRYGHGPVLLRLPIRNEALLLEPGQVERVLKNSPHPFAVASSEKQVALQHFQPKGVLVSNADERQRRREINDAALDAHSPVHAIAAEFLPWLREKTARMASDAQARGELTWPQFITDWFEIVRRVLLGDAARDDHELTDMLAQLRADANWAFLPRRTRLRDEFLARLTAHVERAERGSIAAYIAGRGIDPKEAAQQVPQWLFAFDAAGLATFRTLALLLTHPAVAGRARQEAAQSLSDPGEPASLPFLRASMMESTRLWPTTPLVLRQTESDTYWEQGRLPARSGVLIHLPFFHRDPKLPFADRFAPGLWLGEEPQAGAALVPFSDGPAFCSGRELVLLLAAETLAALLKDGSPELENRHGLDEAQPLPATLDGYSLRFVYPLRT